MKSIFTFVLLLAASVFTASAQTDTTIHYYWGDYRECAKDSAVYISKVYVVGDKWQRNDYWVKGMKPQSQETWLDAKCTRPVGTSTWYNEQGVVIKKQTYQNERTTQTQHFFNNGKKRAILIFDATGRLVRETGWDTTGVVIPGYIHEREARFPGGMEGWKQYLTSRLDINTAAKAKAPVGIYTVKVQFLVDKAGKTSQVQAVTVPAECPKCGVEAVKLIKNSPNWEPAVQYGHPVIYQAIQYVSWQVVD